MTPIFPQSVPALRHSRHLFYFPSIWYVYHLEGPAMVQAYSRLKRVLDEQNMTVPELHRRIQQQGLRVNLKSLYRLSNNQQPLQRLNLRLAGAICHVFEIPLSELIAFEAPHGKLRRISAVKQKRLDTLMTRNNKGRLTDLEQQELRALVHEAEAVMLDNARTLAGQREQLTTP
jgi:hypothetical protein